VFDGAGFHHDKDCLLKAKYIPEKCFASREATGLLYLFSNHTVVNKTLHMVCSEAPSSSEKMQGKLVVVGSQGGSFNNHTF
jgi:hypothetical protein